MSKLITLCLPAVVLLAACFSNVEPQATYLIAHVTATTDNKFNPKDVFVYQGGSVVFTFGTVGHSVEFDEYVGRPDDIDGVNAQISISRDFGRIGTFTFHCTIHEGMTGSVVVVRRGATDGPQ